MAKPVSTPPKPSYRRPLLGAACVLALATVVYGGLEIPFGGAAADSGEPAPKAVPAAKAAAKTPVILLTGYQPFGEKKPLNPSWEAIKDLDGKEWKGYRLVCREMPVVWGAPMAHLGKWIDEFEPAAIFSFGQGGKGAFALESRASNKRGDYKDNDGATPKDFAIAKDGPEQFRSAVDCQKLACILREKGWPVLVSTSAGHYLCEECLYTLEYLKAKRHLDGPVMFCHVPPLNTKMSKTQEVTPQYVQHFITDLMDAWYATYQGEAGQDVRDIKEFINRYFRSWSQQDMKGYDSCFMPDACIQHLDAQGRLTSTSRLPFVASQREYHRNAPFKTTEVPEAVDIRIEEKLARVVVYWKLTAGPRLEYGYDHFTLMRHGDGWRIANLIFYSVPAAKKAG